MECSQRQALLIEACPDNARLEYLRDALQRGSWLSGLKNNTSQVVVRFAFDEWFG